MPSVIVTLLFVLILHATALPTVEEFADKLSTMNSERGWNFQLATCGEKIDIAKYGISHNRCVDGDLITRLAWNDKELMHFSYVRYLENRIRDAFGFAGNGLKFIIRERKEDD